MSNSAFQRAVAHLIAWDDAGVTLVLAGIPIGDPGDASARLRSELADADVIAAEDTRRLRRLLSALNLSTSARVVSYFDGNEAARTTELVEQLLGGSRVVLVTDAGMPSVSDPGYRLVAASVEAGVHVTTVPGPSAVTAALAVSGLAVDRFCFEGFLPRKAGERTRALGRLADELRTMVFFESRHRLIATLEAMVSAFGADRRAVVCRELTKTHEEIRRGTLAELVQWATEGVLGEITIVVAGGGPESSAATPEEAVRLVAERVAGGTPRKDAIAEVAKQLGLPKRAVYNAVVADARPT